MMILLIKRTIIPKSKCVFKSWWRTNIQLFLLLRPYVCLYESLPCTRMSICVPLRCPNAYAHTHHGTRSHGRSHFWVILGRMDAKPTYPQNDLAWPKRDIKESAAVGKDPPVYKGSDVTPASRPWLAANPRGLSWRRKRTRKMTEGVGADPSLAVGRRNASRKRG